MITELGKVIMDRQRNKYLKYPSRKIVNMKKIKYKCNCICKKYKIQYLKGSTEKGVS